MAAQVETAAVTATEIEPVAFDAAAYDAWRVYEDLSDDALKGSNDSRAQLVPHVSGVVTLKSVADYAETGSERSRSRIIAYVNLLMEKAGIDPSELGGEQ